MIECLMPGNKHFFSAAAPDPRRILFIFFLLSGFCSLTYEIVWLRLAYASFGVNTPVMSIVISVFMSGLALGSWLGGKYIYAISRRYSALFFYAGAEGVIGLGAFLVPVLFGLGQWLLLNAGPADSSAYLFLSALLLAASLLPWCCAMGATFPFGMEYLRQSGSSDRGSFSFLYLANVIGAMLGAAATAVFLVELAGFRGTLHAAAGINITVAISGFLLASRISRRQSVHAPARKPVATGGQGNQLVLATLFMTGFTSMGMEVTWIRDFTPVLGTQIYSFAALLVVYLLATWVGSATYRYRRAQGKHSLKPGMTAGWAGAFALLPVLLNDPRNPIDIVRTLGSIMPFCFVLGYLTPGLVDAWSHGDPARAGRAYAANIIGCILGPLAASYLIIPFIGVQGALGLLAVPYLVMFPFLVGKMEWKAGHGWLLGAGFASLMVAVFYCQSYETMAGLAHPPREMRRDYSATVVAYGKGLDKQLSVNGMGLTILSPITKVMAHLPMMCLKQRPKKVLVICFGMGTTFRSMASWNVDTTAVELVPSVRDSFGFFFPDGPALLGNPRFRVAVDDGRRFLARTREKYDVITVDPPPPEEAAASSLLYSREFYILARSRMAAAGILAQWYPGGDVTSGQSTLRALTDVFPHVRAFRSCEGWGIHFLASMEPIIFPGEDVIRSRMPAHAVNDLLEWPRIRDFHAFCRDIPGKELGIQSLLNPDPGIMLTDDRPFNEYYLLRRTIRSIIRNRN